MATFEIKLKPFPVPYVAVVDLPAKSQREAIKSLLPTIPVEELSDDAVEDLAFEWLGALYAACGKRCPFSRPARAMAA